jgi:hypothetical protein
MYRKIALTRVRTALRFRKRFSKAISSEARGQVTRFTASPARPR